MIIEAAAQSLADEAVLVTGSSGFIGFPVAQELARCGSHVVGLDPASPIQQSLFHAVQARCSDSMEMLELLMKYKIKFVIHCGGVSGQMLSRDNPLLVCESNV